MRKFTTALVALVATLPTTLAFADDDKAPPGAETDARPKLVLAAILDPAAPAKDRAQVGEVPGKEVEEKLGASQVPGWALRGPLPGTSLRLDTSVAPQTMNGNTAVDTVQIISGSYKISKHFGVGAKFGVNHYEPVKGPAQNGILNTVVSAQYGTEFAKFFRFGLSLGFAAPTGSGSGNTPDPNMVAAQSAGKYTRAMYDNTMFSYNEILFPTGADLAFVYKRFTAQVEVNASPAFRVQGEAKSPDPERLPVSTGAMVGVFVHPKLSASAELRYTSAIGNPVAVQKDPSSRDNLSFAAGLRTYLPITGKVTFRPGLSYGAGMYGKLADLHYQFVQVDLPIAF